MNIFTRDNIFLNQKLHSKEEVFDFIINVAFDLKITDNKEKLLADLQAREAQISTGLEQEFAIPHAQSEAVKSPTLFYISLESGIAWENQDQSKAKYLFVILLPKKYTDDTQVELLAQIATMILDEKQIVELKSNNLERIYQAISNQSTKQKSIKINEEQPLALAITSCPVGIAHTYLAAEKISEAFSKAGFASQVETRGSVGPKNVITQEQIDKAQFVIIAADVQIETEQFIGKKVLFCSTKDAIHQADKMVEKAQSAPILKGERNISTQKSDKPGLLKHVITGISYMIPYVVFGGIMIALSLGIGKSIYGSGNEAPKGDFLWYMLQIGVVSFNIMIGALGAYIAYSIAGRAALMPAFVTSTVANNAGLFYNIGGINVQTPMGFLGAILFGYLIGYTVKYIANLKIQNSISAVIPIFVIPIGVTLFYSLIVVFVIGAPIGYVMDKFIKTLESVFSNKDGLNLGIVILLGFLLGGMIGFDMGGPINKVAFLTSATLVASKIFEPMGMVAAAIPVAPIGMGLTTLVFGKKFDRQEKSLGISAIIMGFIGISEGAIPFAVSDPKRVVFANVIGSAVAGAIAAALSVTNAAAHGGPIVGVLGAISSNNYGVGGGIAFFFVAILIGSVVTMLIYGLTRNRDFKFFSSNKINFLSAKKAPRKDKNA
ncbi:PTS system protein [Mesomycoplasma conjunctivae]|uniref:PTS system, fructose-specific IIABC component n=1 Tax=Mesomycoplasma conjunctivae (strain ATCC 25834 / NCTC 10147 / HRC/581) TaxID=572263 RepID=C5J6W9_MESCH|nr:fructose-specific PTS transporter subunit EIIC [Mesomycoplasma conjunctivae]CAT05232.1 PTS system, fructose-specific IIABC component [Mesomycoplasma conjunctivae]VEU66453.1 PTS system protein [Mesomycoplasma conjunctivae]